MEERNGDGYFVIVWIVWLYNCMYDVDGDGW